MKKTIITISMTVAMAAFLSVGCGEKAATEPTAADEAEGGQAEADPEAGDPSSEESNSRGSTPGKEKK
ncbi:MAG: hypothetical protein P8M70_05110 [Verrucomicrobiota bacterium]|nr:hypothetical protein [Verrucomicrobiota bacterium]